MAKKIDRNRNNKQYQNKNDEFNRQYKNFASTSAILSSQSASSGTSGVTESRMKSMLQDPSKNSATVANFSASMKNINGQYKRIIKYMSSLLTFDHILYPVFENPVVLDVDVEQTQMAYSQTATFLDKLNIKYNLPIFTEKLFTKGVTYQYKIEDSKGVSYQDFPTEYCRVAYVEDGVFRYQFDLSRLTETLIVYYPKELVTAYTSYKNGQTDKLIDGKWYQVSDKGVAFTIDSDVLAQSGMSLPPLANMLIDTIKVENAKENMVDDAELDNSKIVHSKIETDDRGVPLMELDVVMEYHNAIKRNLPKGSIAITNPFDTATYTLSGTGKDSTFNLLDKSVALLYEGSGVSQQLFAGDGTSSKSLEMSVKIDTNWLYSFLLPMFANYYNYELKKASKKGVASWKIKFLEVAYHDREDSIKLAKDQLSFGGSRLTYFAYNGMTPLEAVNIMSFEQNILDIDTLMVSKQTSYTQSGDSGSGEVGRPESDHPTDDTVRINDSE